MVEAPTLITPGLLNKDEAMLPKYIKIYLILLKLLQMGQLF